MHSKYMNEYKNRKKTNVGNVELHTWNVFKVLIIVALLDFYKEV